MKQQKKTLCCHQVGQIWSYRALVKAPESSRRDLAIEKGFRACFLRDKRGNWDVHTVWKSHTCFFHQVGQGWSYRALVKALESSRRDLAIEKGSRACFLKNKRKKYDFSYGLEVGQRKQTLFWHQVGQIWSYRALVKASESCWRDLAIQKGFRACF